MAHKEIKKSFSRECAGCGNALSIIVYSDKTYQGGHYFGKIPLSSKKELARAMKAGTHPEKMGSIVVQVMNEDPKPYKFVEHWECSKCYK